MNQAKFFFTSLIILLIFSIYPLQSIAAGSASINLLPQTGSYKVGQTFNVVISVNPGPDKIDMVRAKINFPSDILEVKSFSTSSVFSYQAGSNGFDNSTGIFSWGAGTPGGITTATNFGTIVFAVKKSGNAQVSVGSGSLALSAGVDKFNGQLSSATYSLVVASASKPAATKNNAAQPPVVVAQPFENTNTVKTQILPNPQSNNFSASLLDSFLSSQLTKLWFVLAIILLVIIISFALYKITEKPILSSKNNKK